MYSPVVTHYLQDEVLQSGAAVCAGDFSGPGTGIMPALAACTDLALLRQSAAALGLEPGGPDEALLEAYLTDPALAAVSPNAYFDEQWYRLYNRDVGRAIEDGKVYSGFTHYVAYGLFEGRWPNQTLQLLADTAGPARPPVAAWQDGAEPAAPPGFLRAFPLLTATEYYNLFGRFLAPAPAPDNAPVPAREAGVFDQMAREFDAEFYAASYLADGDAHPLSGDPFSHYLVHGIKHAHSPNRQFDERWYVAFYGEVRTAIARGEILNGFYHFIAAGRAEGRLSSFDRKLALEARMPGVTRPVLLHRISEIRGRMAQRPVKIVEAPPRIWFLMPTMNPDITFGGYRSALELIGATHNAGYAAGILCTEDASADKEYFLWRETSAPFKKLVNEIPIHNLADRTEIEVGANDTIVAYSVWDLYTADHLRNAAPNLRVILLTQEYEPIFYDNCSTRAIAEQAYAIPHFPIINSQLLCNFLSKHKIGVFGRRTRPRPGIDYAVFEHRINILPSQSAAAMRRRKERVLVAYARPEGHAARNMFEVLVLALRQVCGEGLFGPQWRFIGLGALTELEPVPLGGDHELVIHPKMTEEEYTGYISCMDIGVSLMFAPHPSVVPFEFATTGALVVTNTYENRSAAALAAISRNIIAGHPGIDGIADALRQAVARVDDAPSRVQHIYRPQNANWASIFNHALLQAVFGPPPEAA